METYCVSCTKKTANKNSSLRKAKPNRLILLSNFVIYNRKNLTFIKNKELQSFND